MNKFELSGNEIGKFLLWVIPALIAGILLSLLIPKPVIGVIRLNDAIYAATAKDLISQITYARDNPDVRAVVLILDSPGGTVVDTEAVYMELTTRRCANPADAPREYRDGQPGAPPVEGAGSAGWD